MRFAFDMYLMSVVDFEFSNVNLGGKKGACETHDVI